MQVTTENFEWANAFRQRWADLVEGKLDVHNIIDWGYELFPEHGHKPPAEVADEQFAELRREVAP